MTENDHSQLWEEPFKSWDDSLKYGIGPHRHRNGLFTPTMNPATPTKGPLRRPARFVRGREENTDGRVFKVEATDSGAGPIDIESLMMHSASKMGRRAVMQ